MTTEKNATDRIDALYLAIEQVNQIILGKPEIVQLAFACLLCGGHLLIEDLPGMGKTTLAQALAHISGLRFKRIQFTSDLLPSDITGLSIYEPDLRAFKFHPGPLFANLVMADELNRAMPKTQSALLEAMSEQQVTVDGQTHQLPKPFFVVGTQNATDFTSTFALPDSQLDRFLMQIKLGYPSAEAERHMLEQGNRSNLLNQIKPVLDADTLIALRCDVDQVKTNAVLMAYLQALVTATRNHPEIRVGLSPRAGLALLSAARATALLNRRTYVIPEDVQAVFIPVTTHRLLLSAQSTHSSENLASAVLKSVSID
jgi:MoxR-like ATPase